MVAYLSAGCMPGHLVGRYVREPARALPDGEMVVGTEHLNGSHHVVQFYGHDHELTERVAGCLLRALEDGGAAIVIDQLRDARTKKRRGESPHLETRDEFERTHPA